MKIGSVVMSVLVAGDCMAVPGSSVPAPPGSSAPAPPPVTHVAVCKLLARGDGTTGLFQARRSRSPTGNDRDGKYFDAPAASWVEGLGLTCDNPVLFGYRSAGYSVAWGGKRDPNPSTASRSGSSLLPEHDPQGVDAPGINDLYPYFTR